MQNAGESVVREITKRWSACRTAILCGPGNNGGDGYVIARLLQEQGWDVRVAAYGDVTELAGDAAAMAARWGGPVQCLSDADLRDCELIVDALFGAGLSRPLDREVADVLAGFCCPVVAVDMPSGVDGNTGAIMGGAPNADLTVTFCRPKTGHLLLPGRAKCGELAVADIGIADETIESLRAQTGHNGPAIWARQVPWPTIDMHKYRRGHLVVTGGGIASSGAARLAARAGLRVGAGLVTCAVPPSAVTTYAAHLTSIMIRPVTGLPAFAEFLSHRRVAALVMGPGQGLQDETRDMVLDVLEKKMPTVLDADALSVFEGDPDALLTHLHPACVLTPHEGEFLRLFDGSGDRLSSVRRAAERAGTVVLLKGPDTVIADPTGKALINSNAPADLATAGSGDVLAGLIGGLLAQGMDTLDAAGAGVWLHGETGRCGGPGLIAEDLPDLLPGVLRRLKEMSV